MSVRRFGPLPAAIALATGIAIAPHIDQLGIPAWPRWLIVAAALVLLLVRRRGAVVLALGAAIGAARGARSEPVVPAGVVIDDRIADRVVGTVRGPIVHGAHGDGALLETGEAALWLWSDAPLSPGARVAVTGMVRTPRGLRDPAMPDRADAMRARGAELEVTARSMARLDARPDDRPGAALDDRPGAALDDRPGATLDGRDSDEVGLVDRAWRWAGATQAAWARTIDRAGGDPTGSAALRGIAVGDRATVSPELDQRWRAIGIFHVLSVSGLHLAVVAGLAFAALRRLVAASPWGGRTRPARWAAPPALALAIAYTMITGAQIATLRSLLAIALVLTAQFLDRPLRLVDAIGAAAIAILLWRPADLLDPSFQLSFTAALALALVAAAGGPRAAGVRGGIVREIVRSVVHGIVRGVRASAWVALATAPLTAYHFQQVAPSGVVGNVVLTPVIELVALPLGLAGAVLGAAPAIVAAAWIVGVADRGAAALAEIAPVGHVAVASAAVMAVLAALSLGLAARAGQQDRRSAALWLALCLVWSLGRTPPPPGALRVTFLDVGQGDAALVELPDGAVWLVDAGGTPGARDAAAAAAPGRMIDRVLAAYGHAGIDLAIVSHPHPDHYLGLTGIAAPIAELWSADEPEGARDRGGPAARSPGAAPGFAAVTAELARRGTRLVHPALGAARHQAGVELVVWAPRHQPAAEAAVRCASDPVRTVNDNSLVIELRFAGRRLLFAGDLEAEGEDVLVAAGIGPADIVKVPHHGSPTSSTGPLITATRPALAVISCGAANPFGFPSEAVIERWRAAGAAIARTDRDGAITVTIDAAGALAIERFVP